MRQNYSFSKNGNALLEPCEGKLSCTVLRGESPSNGADLLDTKIAYDFDFQGFCLQLNAGVQNIFNSYQKDFDKGASRDSGYIYGPGAPRSYFAGVKLSF